MSAPSKLPTSAATRLLVSVAAGLVAGGVAVALLGWSMGPLVGLIVLHLVNLAWGWATLWPLDAELTKANAKREDFNPAVVEILGLVISLGALLAIVTIMLMGSSKDQQALDALLALAGVMLSWGSLHLMYTGHYAYLYYDGRKGAATKGTPGGIDWNDDDHEPTYRDFLYFSYNLGMTYQVSDTSVSSPPIRYVTLRHCIISYFFGAAILGATINIVAGMASGGGS